MLRNPLSASLLLFSLTFLVACDNSDVASPAAPETAETKQVPVKKAAGEPAPPAQADAVDGPQPIELNWDELIPDEWRPDKLMEEFDAVNLSDDDPRAIELAEKLKAFWKDAPVVEKLDGDYIKLPGYVVPLELDAERIREFLLVPYFGACIHVPPPPANQTVHVVADDNLNYKGKTFDTVWITGTLKVERLSSDLGDAGYRIDASKIEPYDQSSPAQP